MSEQKPKRRYTKGEEIFNAVSHIVGASLGVVALIVGTTLAAIHNDAWAIASAVIYAICLILMYTASSIYHFLRENRAKRLFRIFDHCSIFLLIAGTYTPFCLVTLRTAGAWGWSLLGVLWLMAIVGICIKSIFMHKKFVKWLGMAIYLGMGWCAMIAIYPIVQTLHPVGLGLTIAGGVVYTIGAIFYLCGRKKRYIHSVWHLFVLAASILHFFAILFYVLMA
jgi:hemolysin III